MIKQITEEFRPELERWWLRHNYTAIPLQALPKKHGFVWYEKDTPVCAAWIYFSDDPSVKFAWVLLYVKNPDASPSVTTAGFTGLNTFIDDYCKSRDCWGVITFTGVPSLEKRLEDHGFARIEPGSLFVNSLVRSA